MWIDQEDRFEIHKEEQGFRILYNPLTDVGPETALSVGDEYYILIGDYRSNYEGMSLSEALVFFKQHEYVMHPWSDEL